MALKSVLVSLLAGSVVVVGGGVAAANLVGDPGPERAKVVKVVDGDTLDVTYSGATHRIRLLNIDAPETKDPHKLVECLGPEASDFLSSTLKRGDRVRLEFDRDLHDRYGRELAGVYKDGQLINAEIARRGLGVPVIFEPNRKFYPPVAEAFEEAKVNAVGIFDPAQPCTIPARIEAYESQVATAAKDADPAKVEDAADDAVSAGDELLALLAATTPKSLAAAGLAEGELDSLKSRVTVAQDKARESGQQARATIEKVAKEKVEKQREAEEKKAKEEAAAKAKAEKEAAERAAQERAAQERAEQERARQHQPAPAPQPRPAPAPQPAPAQQPAPQPQPAPAPPPANPGLTYTGCRAYVGGPYIDKQGRRYTPIDCTTKAPLAP